MTRFPDRDPEVLADLRARQASEGDRSRTRPDGWVPPAIVERWPCTGCNALVDMPRGAIELHAMFNRQLARRGERPLPKRIPCPSCKARDEDLAHAQRRPHEQRTIAGLEPGGKGRP